MLCGSNGPMAPCSTAVRRRRCSAATPAACRFELPSPQSATQSLVVTLTMDIGNDTALLRRIGLTLLAAALAGALVISVGGFLLVRLGLRPLRQLVDQTRRLAADTLHRRLDGSSQPEELEPMIAQFNELLGRLELAYERVEGFNADVAHELCTPLATLIGSTELALRKSRRADELREVLASNLEELQRVAGIVQDMLFLSQADRGATARRVPTCSLAAGRPTGGGLPRGGDGRCADRSGSMRRCCGRFRHRTAAKGAVQPDRQRDTTRPARDPCPRGDRCGPGGRSGASSAKPRRHDRAGAPAQAVRPLLSRRPFAQRRQPKPWPRAVDRRGHCAHARWSAAGQFDRRGDRDRSDAAG